MVSFAFPRYRVYECNSIYIQFDVLKICFKRSHSLLSKFVTISTVRFNCTWSIKLITVFWTTSIFSICFLNCSNISPDSSEFMDSEHHDVVSYVKFVDNFYFPFRWTYQIKNSINISIFVFFCR